MKRDTDSQAKQLNWTEIEAKWTTGQTVESDSQDHDLKVFKARLEKCDLREAEALCHVQDTDLLQKVRVLMSRGLLRQASELLETALRSNPQFAQESEVKLELARLDYYCGRWQECEKNLSQLFESTVSPSTKMTTLQVRSLARFEQQKWASAAEDLETIKSLAKLYPTAPVAFYAELTSLRMAAIRGDASGAKNRIQKLWLMEKEQGTLNLDRLLTLLRAEALLAAAGSQDPRSIVLATHLISETLGDDLYSALARLEMHCYGDRSPLLAHQLLEDRTRYAQVDRILKEIESGSPVSTTAQILSAQKNFGSGPSIDDLSVGFKYLLIPREDLLISLQPFNVQKLKHSVRPVKALSALVRLKTATKPQLFAEVFGTQKYIPHLHDGLIHQLISRIRKQYQIEVISNDERFSIPSVLVAQALK